MATLFRWLWYLLPANPVVVRIVQAGSQQQRHQMVRVAYLGTLIGLMTIGLLVGGGLTTTMNVADLAKAGTVVFTLISYAQVILICLLTPLFMAGAIADEQSGRTYDILLTTPLSNLQIVLGAWLGRLFFIVALLVSSLPLFAILLIFGGVPIQSVFVGFAVSGLSAMVVGAIAVTLSVLRTCGRQAVFFFVIAITAYLVAGYALDHLLLRRLAWVASQDAGSTTWLTPLHPLLIFEASLNSSTYRTPPAEVLGALPVWARFYIGRPLATFALLTGLASTVLVLGSSFWLRRLNQNNSRWAMIAWLRQRLGLSLANTANPEQRRRPRLVWSNPIAWREAKTRSNPYDGPLVRWGFVIVSVGLTATALGLYHVDGLPTLPDPSGVGPLKPHQVLGLSVLTLLLIESAVIVLVAIYRSASSVSREREDGTLDLTLTTPITPKQYLWGKVRGQISSLALLLAAPVLTLALVSLYGLIGQLRDWPNATVPYEWINPSGKLIVEQVDLMLVEAPVLMALMFVPFVAMCVMVGMHWSVKAKTVLGAVVPAVGIIGCLAMVMGLCGYNAAQRVPLIGPILNAMSPATNIVMLTNPWEQISGYAQDPGFGRLSLALAATTAGGAYSLIVYAMLHSMVRGFDHTVRHLSAQD